MHQPNQARGSHQKKKSPRKQASEWPAWSPERARQGKKKSPPPGGRDSNKEKKEPAAAYFPPVWSIIGAGGLDFRVRNGNGYCPSAMATGTTIAIHAGEAPGDIARWEAFRGDPRPRGREDMARAHGLLVPLGCARRRACTCGLSTR